MVSVFTSGKETDNFQKVGLPVFFTLNRVCMLDYAQKQPNTVSRDFSKSTLRPLNMDQSVYPYFWSHYFITHLFVSNFFSIKGFEFKTVTYRFSHRQKQQPKLLDQNFSFYQWCKNAVIFLLLLREARRVLSTLHINSASVPR